MAIDTRDKRFNCLNVMRTFTVAAPNPDGDISSQADRQQIAFSYLGIAAAGGAAILYSWWAWQRFGEPL